jgi:pyrimidine-nucleoside phosphorylase
MRAVDIIRAKRDGQALSRDAVDAFVRGATDGAWESYQVSALLMAIVLKGMSADETTWLTDAMVRSGERVDLSSVPGIKVGKHSTGGVGDKVSIVLAPVAAACGVPVPKMSGRGLGHTGGTLDKLEAIPGFRVSMTLDEFRAAMARVGSAMISQTANIAPADKTLYALRDVTATVDSIPLIAASVMSKKIAEGADAVVLDVKCGRGAFMKTSDEARALARSLVSIGTAAGLRTEAFITAMDQPLGFAVGNALEIVECVRTLRHEGPPDLQALVLRLAGRMLQLGGKAGSDAEAQAAVTEALTSGRALAKFREMVQAQGGDPGTIDDPSRLPRARSVEAVVAPADGFVTVLDAELIGRASSALGAGRETVGGAVDPAVGIVLRRKLADPVRRGEPVMDLHYNDAARLAAAVDLAGSSLTIGPAPGAVRPLIVDHVSWPFFV